MTTLKYFKASSYNSKVTEKYSENRNFTNLVSQPQEGSEAERLRLELLELKNKMKIVTAKFSKMKKEKTELKRINTELNEEVLGLQSQ